MSSDQCGFPMFCCEKPLEEQAASLEYSGFEEESQDNNFGQVSGCSYCGHGLVSVYEESMNHTSMLKSKPRCDK